MLIKKPPTQPSPPKMSLHWAVPWPDETYAKKQANTCSECGHEVERKKNSYYDPIANDPSEEYNLFCECEHGPTLDITPEDKVVYTPLGKEHNWTGAMKINYKNEDIRVFPDEFNFITAERMKELVDESHELVVSESKPIEQAYNMIMDTDQKDVYEAALLDGSAHNQAIVVAAGGNVFVDEGASSDEFPVLGWYRCLSGYAQMFCEEWEMKE